MRAICKLSAMACAAAMGGAALGAMLGVAALIGGAPAVLWAQTVAKGTAAASGSTQSNDRDQARALERDRERDREHRLQALSAERTALAKEQQTLLNELRGLEIDRQARGIELVRASEAVDEVSRRLTETMRRHEQAKRELDALAPLVRHRLVRLYKLGSLGYSRLLLDAREARAFRETTQVVSAMARRDRSLLDRYQSTLAALTAQRTRLDTERRESAARQADLEAARAALERAITVRTVRVKEIEGRQDLNRKLVAELSEASGRLDKSVENLSAASMTGSAPAGTFTVSSSAAYAWPVGGPAAVISTFGRERTSRFGTHIARNGIQIAAKDEEPVLAARDGTVAYAEAFQGFGQLVILEHGGKTFSLYGHLARMSVVRGDRVRQGQPLGAVGRTPTGESALYFELRIDGRPVDPVRWLKR